MDENIFELNDFKEYLPLKIDITDKNTLIYNPTLAPNTLKIPIEKSLTEEELYKHMKNNSNWSFVESGIKE